MAVNINSRCSENCNTKCITAWQVHLSKPRVTKLLCAPNSLSLRHHLPNYFGIIQTYFFISVLPPFFFEFGGSRKRKRVRASTVGFLFFFPYIIQLADTNYIFKPYSHLYIIFILLKLENFNG